MVFFFSNSIISLLSSESVNYRGQTMKYFGINYFCNHKHHADAIWAKDRYELEKQILTMHPNATAIYIWLL